MLFTLVLFPALVLTVQGDRSMLRTTNVDTRYYRWPNQTAINYCIDTNTYTTLEQNLITAAIQSMVTSMKSCINFVPMLCTDTRFKLRFTSVTNDPSFAPFVAANVSASNPGLDSKFVDNTTGKLLPTSVEQIVYLKNDLVGCSVNPRCVLKMIAILLGKRNEHQRTDRDSGGNLVMQNGNLKIPGAYTLYTAAQAVSIYPYDYCSITHNQPTDYANPGTVAFTVPKAPGFIPQLPTISTTDCWYISRLYQPACNYQQCATINCASQVSPSSTTSGTAPTNPTASTTAASSSVATSTAASTAGVTSTTAAPACAVNFCSATPPKIDEATVTWNGNYYLFSGNCAQQVQPNVNVIGSSVPISSIFPGVTGPLASVWTDPATKLTNVVTQAGTQFVCNGMGCIPAGTPVAPFNPRFELGANTYSINVAAQIFTNDQTAAGLPTSFVACPTACTYPGTLTWTGGYMISAGIQNAVIIIGTDGTGAQWINQLVPDAFTPGLFDFVTNGITVAQALACPPAG